MNPAGARSGGGSYFLSEATLLKKPAPPAPTPAIVPVRSTTRQRSIEPFLTPGIMLASTICAFAVGIGLGLTWNGAPEPSLAAVVSTAPVDGGSKPTQPAAPQVETPGRAGGTTKATSKPVFRGTLVVNSSVRAVLDPAR